MMNRPPVMCSFNRVLPQRRETGGFLRERWPHEWTLWIARHTVAKPFGAAVFRYGERFGVRGGGQPRGTHHHGFGAWVQAVIEEFAKVADTPRLDLSRFLGLAFAHPGAVRVGRCAGWGFILGILEGLLRGAPHPA